MTPVLAPPAADIAARLAACGRLIGHALPHVPFAAAVGLDGSATGTRDGRFLAGCSVPRRAAERMIRKENWPGRTLALVTPTHAQQIAAVLDRLGPTRALVVLLAGPDAAADLLAVIDFTAELAAGRLHVAWDADTLRAVHARWPGVAAPQQMARLPDADADAATSVIDWAKPVLASLATAPATTSAAGPHDRPARRVQAGRQFRLWHDSGDTLARTLGDATAAPRDGSSNDAAASCVLDTDLPTHAAVTFVEAFARGASVVVAADTGRPAWLGPTTAWACWVTTPGVPPHEARHARDAVLLADPAWRPLATRAGWPAHRVAVAGWPAAAIAVAPDAPPAILLDRPDLATPGDFEDVTARRLVWEAVREELTANPFAVGDDPLAYVRRAPARLGLPPDAELPAERYVQTLVGPAYAVGMVRWLTRQALPFTLHGDGWDDAAASGHGAARNDRTPGHGPPGHARDAARAIRTRPAMHAAVAASCGLIDLSLPNVLPAAAALGVPLVRTFGRTASRVTNDVAALRAGVLSGPAAVSPALSWAVVDAATAARPVESAEAA